jgi:hypothetical protein
MQLISASDLMPKLQSFKKILVTGPQRSGTTIASRILAEELKLNWCLEELIDVDNLEKFFKLHFERDEYVLQAPGLSYICHQLPVDAVVFVWRNDDDIAKSATRISWESNEYELRKYFFEPLWEDGIHPYPNSWKLKKTVWETRQIKTIQQAFTLDYESLKTHPLWIDREQRTHFHARQTEL